MSNIFNNLSQKTQNITIEFSGKNDWIHSHWIRYQHRRENNVASILFNNINPNQFSIDFRKRNIKVSTIEIKEKIKVLFDTKVDFISDGVDKYFITVISDIDCIIRELYDNGIGDRYQINNTSITYWISDPDDENKIMNYMTPYCTQRQSILTDGRIFIIKLDC